MKTRAILALTALLLVTSLVFPAAADSGTATITAGTTVIVNNPNAADRLNLRTQPSQDAPTLGKYYNGTYLQALSDEKDGWVKVRIFDLEGYMMAGFLTDQEHLEPGAATIPTVKIANAGGTGLNLRKEQSLSSASLGLYPNGSAVRVFGVSETWCHVQTEDGNVGFMLREHLSPLLEYQKSSGTSQITADTAVINNPNSMDRLNLRAKPSQDAATLGKYYSGTVVEVLSVEQSGWTKVRIQDLEGYMMTNYLAFGDDQWKIGRATPTVQVSNPNGTGLNLRQGQSTSAASLGLYPNGSAVTVYGVSETWCHVQTQDGNMGFMLREKLSPVLDFVRTSAPTGDELEGSWFGNPGDPITDDFMPGGNG